MEGLWLWLSDRAIGYIRPLATGNLIASAAEEYGDPLETLRDALASGDYELAYDTARAIARAVVLREIGRSPI